MSSSNQRGTRQTAYQILVASTPEQLESGEGDLWDTGKVSSNQSLHIRYAGQALKARQACFWQVRIWDQDDQESSWSPVSKWEIGLPNMSDWQGAQWIQLETDTRQSPLAARPVKSKFMDRPDVSKSHPAPLFRNEITVAPDLIRARAYISGLGYSEMYVSGHRTANDVVLSPGQTTYDVRAFYTTHDITGLLQEGSNAIGVMMGNGFFGQDQAFHAPGLGYGKPALLAKIVLDYADGRSATVGTDSSWKANVGPVVYDNVYGGESYDARLEILGWNQTGFDDASWQDAITIDSPTRAIVAQMIPEIRRMETLPTQQIIAGKDGKWIFDIGRNIAGWARIQIAAPAGTVISMEFAEVLMPEGNALDIATTGGHATGLKQKEIYVCKGGGLETWEPRFTYHGFRYVEVDGLIEKPSEAFLSGILVHTDVPARGAFACSDDLLNRIYQTSMWTLQDNMHSVIEDCPHREKCAWLGDAHAVGQIAIYNYDMPQFWTKFVDDIETVLGRGGITYWKQKATPGIPCNIAVGRRLCQEARPDWGSAYILVPWYLHTYYGDTDVFTRHYHHLDRWIDYVAGLREDGIVVRGYGDWCPPGGNDTMECPPSLTSTALFYGTLRIMEGFAGELGKTEDVQKFQGLADETHAAFNREFFDSQTGGYGSQTADAVALRFNLSPTYAAGRVGNSLRAAVVDEHQGHANVGIHGGRSLYTELCESGFEDVAFAALRKETFPGYGYTLKQGFTTWPEVPLEYEPGQPFAHHSLNHPMQSGFAAWFHECVGGIKPAAPAFAKVNLKPFGFTQLEWVKTYHESPYGKIISDWKVEAGRFEWSITIPANTTAVVHVPSADAGQVLESMHPASDREGVTAMGTEEGRALFEVQSGRYEFSSRINTSP